MLVTGASGYLGVHLCQSLLREHFIVRAFVRSTSDVGFLRSAASSSLLQIAYGDVTDLRSLVDACSGCDVVFHAAALVEPWLPDPSRFSKINVEGLKNVLQACKETESIQKIIYTSSFFALGCTDGYVADENQVHGEKFFCTEYERSKAIADKIARESASDGLPLVLVYPGVIYGPGKITAGNLVARLMMERFNGRLPGYVGDGTDKVSFSHVEDVAMGHIAALHKGRVGERYLLTGDNASMTLLFDAAAILTKTKKPWFHIPIWVLNIYGYVSVIIARITGKLPLVSHPTSRVLRHQWAYSCDKAKKELDYNPRNLNEGLSETLSWLKKDGLIKY